MSCYKGRLTKATEEEEEEEDKRCANKFKKKHLFVHVFLKVNDKNVSCQNVNKHKFNLYNEISGCAHF